MNTENKEEAHKHDDCCWGFERKSGEGGYDRCAICIHADIQWEGIYCLRGAVKKGDK